ncbi:hypothetical protein J4450_04305 [Candidatus Micrarchaeota archaeon]|nr:hypothetical protein [Candidatus Micrarchaeota archaeon]
MAVLRFNEIRNLDRNAIQRAQSELSKLGFDKGTILYAARNIYRAEKQTAAHVFVAIDPAVEQEMRDATEILAKDECEFPIKIQSRRYAWHIVGDSEFHFVVIGRTAPPLNPVVLSSQGYEIVDTHFLTFQGLLGKITHSRIELEQAKQNLREVLAIIIADTKERVGVDPSLVLDGGVIWRASDSITDALLAELVSVLSKHGMVGPNFVNLPDENLVEPVYFDFHGHPGYEVRWMIPPSIGDIQSSHYGSANSDETQTQLTIQAVSLRLTRDDFRLFMRPYFRGEDWFHAMFDPMLIRLAYLNEVYNTSRERPIGEESWRILSFYMSIIKFKEDAALAEKFERFKAACEEKSDDQENLLRQWNEILDLMERIVSAKFIPRTNWQEMLWSISGGVIV